MGGGWVRDGKKGSFLPFWRSGEPGVTVVWGWGPSSSPGRAPVVQKPLRFQDLRLEQPRENA